MTFPNPLIQQIYADSTESVQTTTFTLIGGCKHESCIYRSLKLNFWLFKVYLYFMVCEKCFKIIKCKKFWEIRFD